MTAKPRSAPRPGGRPVGRARKIPLIEWLAAGTGLVLVGGSVIFILLEGVRSLDEPPRLAIDAEAVVRSGEGYLVLFRVWNAGSATAAQVEIEGRLVSGAGTIETGQVTIDYVPAGSERRGGFVFDHDPEAYRLDLRVTGYAEP